MVMGEKSVDDVWMQRPHAIVKQMLGCGWNFLGCSVCSCFLIGSVKWSVNSEVTIFFVVGY